MEVTHFFLEQHIPIPFQGRPDDKRNVSAQLIQEIVRTTDVPESGEPVVISEDLLIQLDHQPCVSIFTEVSAIAKFAKVGMDAAKNKQTRQTFKGLGLIATELAELYRPAPPPSRSRRGPNNPYQAIGSSDANLSYQPGAMHARTGRRR